MKRLVTYVINVDEDIAEKAFDEALTALSSLSFINIDVKTKNVEPHDDYKGIITSVDFSYASPAAEESKQASRAVQDLMQELIKTQLWNIPALRVITETSSI